MKWDGLILKWDGLIPERGQIDTRKGDGLILKGHQEQQCPISDRVVVAADWSH